MIILTTSLAIKSRAVLHASTRCSTIGHSQKMICVPSQINSSSYTNGLVSVYLLGTWTRWGADTAWSYFSNGPQIRGSNFSIGDSAHSAWALLLGPGAGTIVLSDGVCRTVLTVQ